MRPTASILLISICSYSVKTTAEQVYVLPSVQYEYTHPVNQPSTKSRVAGKVKRKPTKVILPHLQLDTCHTTHRIPVQIILAQEGSWQAGIKTGQILLIR